MLQVQNKYMKKTTPKAVFGKSLLLSPNGHVMHALRQIARRLRRANAEVHRSNCA
jgi:hypothetical protein